MPSPIRSIPDIDDNKYLADYSFLVDLNLESKESKIATASNKDASLLFEIWCKSERNEEKETFKVDSSISSKDILRLKTKGFLTGGVDEIELTKKGRMVVTTMALGERSQFENNKQSKNYNEILASMDKRGKKGYRIPKYAVNNTNNLRLS